MNLKTLSVFLGLIVPLLLACNAITKKGEKCRRNPLPGTQYCWQHTAKDETSGSNKTAKVVTAKGHPKDDNAVRVQCDAMTKKGKRCGRKALPGGTKCWQHQ